MTSPKPAEVCTPSTRPLPSSGSWSGLSTRLSSRITSTSPAPRPSSRLARSKAASGSSSPPRRTQPPTSSPNPALVATRQPSLSRGRMHTTTMAGPRPSLTRSPSTRTGHRLLTAASSRSLSFARAAASSGQTTASALKRSWTCASRQASVPKLLWTGSTWTTSSSGTFWLRQVFKMAWTGCEARPFASRTTTQSRWRTFGCSHASTLRYFPSQRCVIALRLTLYGFQKHRSG
mmetsp:Transcript_23940/g.67956  ORF Transcript_23940/g.67956 Transcript_23940/m.67956 type:complete len:233 (+) Transcript_23940:1082-1780(+)